MMMRLSSQCIRRAAATGRFVVAAARGPVVALQWHAATPVLPAAAPRAAAASFATMPLPHEEEESATMDLHRIVEDYRQKRFPETLPHEFVDQVLLAADENKDGLIQVGEMMVMLRNLYSHQPVEVEEVVFIMQTQLGMGPDEDAVPMHRVRALLLDINH